MYHTILVPLDGSVLSESVLPEVELLGKRFNSRILLVRAAKAHNIPGRDEVDAAFRVVRAAEQYLELIEVRLRDNGLCRVSSAQWYSDPVSAILDEAIRSQADLIAMSSHGRGGLNRLLLGSVATGVLQGTKTPMLLFRPAAVHAKAHEAGLFRRILMPLDGSELAEQALPEVIALATAMSAEIIMLRVVGSTSEDPSPVRIAGCAESGEATAYLEQVQRYLSHQGVVSRWIVRAGSPAEQICLEARHQVADLIALSAHRRSTMRRFIRGSVADGVMRAAPVPVLLTHGGAVDSIVPVREKLAV